MTDMPDVLARICADKREHVARCKTQKTEQDLIAASDVTAGNPRLCPRPES